jgi:endo-1,4-beta-xylanase
LKRKLLKLALLMLLMPVLAVTAGCAAEEKSAAAQSTDSALNTNSAQGTGGIKDIYAAYGIKAGTCLSDAMLAQSKYTNIITKNFNSITLENYLKPDYILSRVKSIASGDIVVEITPRTTALLDWAKRNGIPVRGHTLIWYSQTPEWIFHQDFDMNKPLVDRDTMLARMESIIRQVFSQLNKSGYLDMFYAYDVVNEAIMDDGTYRNSLWYQVIGADYIWYAFSYADKYASESVKLFYNDFNEQIKSASIIKLAKSLVDKDGRSLIDGIGCQAHLNIDDSIDSYIDALRAYSALGLDLQITELDVAIGSRKNPLNATEAYLKQQGQFYYTLLSRIATENIAGTAKVSAITFWGFADSLSWISNRSAVLFDSALTPKYAYYGAMLEHDRAGF